MSEFIKIPADELERLKNRVKTLSHEKAQLQLLYELISQLTPGAGLKQTIKSILHLIMNTIGGTNIIIYYKLDNEWFSFDIYEELLQITEFNDPLVKKAIDNKIPVEGAESNSLMIGPESESFSTITSWIFPFIVNEEAIGAIKMQGIRLSFDINIKKQIQVFINYISLVLQNELINFSKLKIAYDKIREYSENLEQKVEDRTKELEEKNRELEHFNQLFMDREFRIKELRDKIKELEGK